MTRISLISSSAELRMRLRPLTGDTSFSPAGGTGDAHSMMMQFRGEPPEVLIMDCRADVDGKLALAAVLIETYPAIGVLLVSDRQAELALHAMRVGVQDILSPEASMEEFGATAESIAKATRNRVQQLSEFPADAISTKRSGRVISIMSPKGGVGKTTVSTNIAVGLAQREPGSTVIVDLDVQFGDVASALDLEPTRFIADVAHGAARYDAVVLKAFLTQHKTGLYAICAPNTPEEADAISPEDVTHLLQMLSSEFRYVVLDTAPGMSDTTLAVLNETTDLVLLTGMDVPGIRGLRKELDTLDTLGVTTETRQVVLNFADPRGLLSLADVEATIKTKVDVVLPRTQATVNSINQGIPLLESGQRTQMTKQLHKLVERLAANRSFKPAASKNTVVSPQPSRQSWWRRNKQVAAA
jgi:pilus assembly protein CpaE